MTWRKARLLVGGFAVILLATYGAATLCMGLGLNTDISIIITVVVFLTALFMLDRREVT